MITITLRLSESLLCIFRDAGKPKEEIIQYRAEPGVIVRKILIEQGINLLLVPMITLNTKAGSIRIDRNTSLEKNSVLTLYGPLAGG